MGARRAAGPTAALALLLVACAAPPDAGRPAVSTSGVEPRAAAEDPCRAGPPRRAVVVGSGLAGDPALPEPASGYRLGLRPVQTARFVVATAHPLASRAGCEVLAAGGSAADAAVAVQAVLGLVEPQSSGLGGGAFALHYDAATGAVTTYDGRETAPAAASEDDLRWIGPGDRREPLPDVRGSGRSIGVPGTLRLLESLHADHGRRPWAGLFERGIGLAEGGFAVGGRMADAIAAARERLRQDADAAAAFLHPDGTPRGLGERVRNPAYADTLRRVATSGADAFYRGDIAADIVAEVARTLPADAGPAAVAITPGRMSVADLASYRAVRRDPVCAPYRRWIVCGMGPPSSGGIAVAQTLGILESFDLAGLAPAAVDGEGGVPDPRAMHLLAESMRLAFADRNRWVADTDFVPLPGRGAATLLDPHYLARRATLIRPEATLGRAPAGRFDGQAARGASAQPDHGTSHFSIVDADGNAVSMTTSVNRSLGSWRMVRGFVLNDELADFSDAPADAEGPIANRQQGGKRPRSSMAPTLVFERRADGTRGALTGVVGSSYGATIIASVVKTLVGVLDWGLDAQQAAAFVNLATFNTPLTLIGAEHPRVDDRDDGRADPLVAALRALGHDVRLWAQPSGVALIVRDDARGGWQAGVDPRREGLALGQ